MYIKKTDEDFMDYEVIDLDNNGEIIRFIISADDDKGVYVVYDRDDEGYIKFDPKMNPVMKYKKGNIKIKKIGGN